MWGSRVVCSSLALPPAAWQPRLEAGQCKGSLSRRKSPACFTLPQHPRKLGLGLPPFPTGNSLALLLPALGQCTMVNRFSPPFSGLGALGLCPTLHSAQPHPPCCQGQEMVPLSTSLAGSKKQGIPLPDSHSARERHRPEQNPPGQLSLTNADRYGDYSVFPGGSAVKNPPARAGDVGFTPGQEALLENWQPTAVLLPGKSHGWRSVVSYSPGGCKIIWFYSFTCSCLDFLTSFIEGSFFFFSFLYSCLLICRICYHTRLDLLLGSVFQSIDLCILF